MGSSCMEVATAIASDIGAAAVDGARRRYPSGEKVVGIVRESEAGGGSPALS
jgi:hypothetical protein